VTSSREHFLALHHGDQPLLLPNPWDIGSAKLLESLGFQALATTSSGFAATLGRVDGAVTRDEALVHGDALGRACGIPVSADLENCFADDPQGVAETVSRAAQTALAGCSIEDFSGSDIYDVGLAVDRVAAAADAAHAGGNLVLTARAENFLHGRPDLDDTIARLQAYERAGADVLYAPGISALDDLRRIVDSVGRPVNVLARPGLAPVSELAAIGVRRISVGGAFAWVGIEAVVRAGRELLDAGTYGFTAQAADGRTAARAAFTT
jgi:2-methylisocitrate lyase-like PEP mutase family enzyme